MVGFSIVSIKKSLYTSIWVICAGTSCVWNHRITLMQNLGNKTWDLAIAFSVKCLKAFELGAQLWLCRIAITKFWIKNNSWTNVYMTHRRKINNVVRFTNMTENAKDDCKRIVVSCYPLTLKLITRWKQNINVVKLVKMLDNTLTSKQQ